DTAADRRRRHARRGSDAAARKAAAGSRLLSRRLPRLRRRHAAGARARAEAHAAARDHPPAAARRPDPPACPPPHRRQADLVLPQRRRDRRPIRGRGGGGLQQGARAGTGQRDPDRLVPAGHPRLNFGAARRFAIHPGPAVSSLCFGPRRGLPMPSDFETALTERVDAMLDACTKCGKSFEACPITSAAGVADADPQATIAGVLDIVRTGEGPEASRKWASSCVLSGECIKVCDYGVNPRFLLNMARVAMARAKNEPRQQRKLGVDGFRLVARDVTQLSGRQLTDAQLVRLGQDPSEEPDTAEPPDVVFYTGCNVLKTPHIALLALDIMDQLAVRYHVMGGPTHCCGVV